MVLEKRKRAPEGVNVRPGKKSKSSKSITRLIAPKEEPAFQRGGASILTPLEQKQIEIQAKEDALFEQSTGQKARNAEFEDEENEEGLMPKASGGSVKPKANTKAKRKRVKEHDKEEAAGIRIEGLSYKVLRLDNSGAETRLSMHAATRSWLHGAWANF